MKTVVIHHSADFDGIFCREIARKFLPDAELIGWDFKDKPLPIPDGSVRIYVLDLPVDRVFGFKYVSENVDQCPPQHPAGLIWIDHHQSSIGTHPKTIQGYRIDGVAACRLAWQWFSANNPEAWGDSLPTLEDYKMRNVSEPLAVRLAGEYDIWDKRDSRAELFQHGLKSCEPNYELLLSTDTGLSFRPDEYVAQLLEGGKVLQYARANEYREVITQQGFDVEFEGVKFLACNSHELDIRSHLFEAGIKPHHEALLGFTFNGVSKDWRVSMYRIAGKETDVLSIAKKYGGGGHPGACGCRMSKALFL